MPIGKYPTFDACVAANADKANAEGYCAALEHAITGHWPGQHSMPEEVWIIYREAYATNLFEASEAASVAEPKAHKHALEELAKSGWVETPLGWQRYIGSTMKAPKLREVAGVKVFATGNHTDSAGVAKMWTEADLDRMVEAFVAGVPTVCALKAGHTPDSFNTKIAQALDVPVDVVTGLQGQGQIALGRMSSLERKGNLLIASFERVPEAIANLIEGGLYSTVSVEIEDQVGDFGPVITAVALLGAEEPAVDQATLDRSAVFGGGRKGARVFSLAVSPDVKSDELRKEFTDISTRFSDIIKGKKGAPVFRALWQKLTEMYESLAGGGKHQSDKVPEEVVALATKEYQGNVPALIAWVGRVGFDECVAKLTGKEGISDPVKVCGWLKGRAHASNTNKEGNSMKISELKAKFQEPGMPSEGEEAANTLAAIATALGLTEDASLEELIAAIQALAAKAAGEGAAPPPEGGEGETPPPEGEMNKTNFSKMQSTIKTQGETIQRLEHEARVSKYQKITSTFQVVEGKPEDLANDLATLEEKAGEEVAKKSLAAYQAAEKAGEAATRAHGSSKPGTKAVAFEDKVQEFQKNDPKMTRAEAIKATMRAHPDLYEEVRDQYHD